MGLGAGSTVNQTQLLPAPFQQPYVNQLLSEAQRLYQSPGPLFFPGSTVAEFTPTQIAGQQMLVDTAQRAGGVGESLLGAMQQNLSGQQNPYLDQIADVITKRVNQAVTEQWLPAVRSGAISTGTTGGSRQALAETGIGREAARELSDRLAQLYGGAWESSQGRALQTMQLAPSAIGAAMSPGQVTAAVGEQQRELEQAKINEAMTRWMHEQQLPYQKLAEYFNIAGRPFGSAGQSSVTAEGGAGQTAGGILSLLGWLLGWLRGG